MKKATSLAQLRSESVSPVQVGGGWGGTDREVGFHSKMERKPVSWNSVATIKLYKEPCQP